MTRVRTILFVLGLSITGAALLTAGAVRDRAIAQPMVAQGGPMMRQMPARSGPMAPGQAQQHMRDMSASLRSMRAQLARVDPSLLTVPQRAMFDYLTLLQAHLETMHRMMAAGPGMMTPSPGTMARSASGAQAPHSDEQVPPIVPGARTITIEALDFAFRPAEIRMAAGSTVNIVLRNRGAIEHDLAFENLHFHLHVEPGARAAGSLRNLKPGTYEFSCTIPGHRAAGMVGRLIVTR